MSFSLCRCGDLRQTFHVRGLSAVVHRHDGFGARGDERFDVRRVNTAGGVINVREDAARAARDHGVRARHKREARQDDLAFDAAGQDGQMQRRRRRSSS